MDPSRTLHGDVDTVRPAVIDFRDRLVEAGDIGCEIGRCRPGGPLVHLIVPSRTGWAMVVATCAAHAPVAGVVVGRLAADLPGCRSEGWTDAIESSFPIRYLSSGGRSRDYWRWVTDLHEDARATAERECGHPDCQAATRVVTIVIATGRGSWITGSCPAHAIWAGEQARRLAICVS